MTRSSLLSLVAILATVAGLGAVEAPLPRHPAPSPDGSLVAFSWQGDLWLVPSAGGQARRLTAHPAAERFPVWSRDGRLLAFASSRHGNLDVFVMPVDGSSEPRRLTYASTDDTPVDFTPSGEEVLFTSRRDEAIRWMPALYLVPTAGGTPALAQPALGQWGTFSHDGSALAFVRGSTDWSRRGYRGAANREIWLRTADDEYVRLTDFDGDDDCPSWVDGHSLVYLSARSGRKNIHLLNLVTGEARQLTFHEAFDARWPRLSADGSLVAYEYEDAIWTLPTAGGEPARLRVEVPADQVVNSTRRERKSDGASELQVNAAGDLAAFVVAGDVFVTAITPKEDQEIAKPPTVQVTATAERERDLSWSPDGKSLLFASARGGNLDLFLARPADPDTPWTETFSFPAERLTSSQEDEHSARFSPDGSRIAFLRGKGDLVVVGADGSGETVLLRHWDTPSFDWSPDGRFLAYSIPDMDANSEVFIVPVEGGEAYNVSRHPDDDLEPRWSPDGTRLIWTTKRHGTTSDLWGVWLTRADHERTAADWLKYWKAKEKDKDKGEDDDKDEKKKEKNDEEPPELPEVRVDFDGLWERAQAITDLAGDEGVGMVSRDGRRVVFTADHEGERDLYSVRFDGEEVKRLTTGEQEPSEVQQDRDGKTLFYLDGKGTIKRVGFDGTAGDPIPFQARYEVDARAERAATFDEAWKALDDWFYDPSFHGVDWPAQHRRYRPWALAASSDEDFADVMELLLGELNASHMGYSPPDPEEEGETTGWIGALFDPRAGGPGILVREVLRDSPAARQDAGLKPGERILSVNGRPVTETTSVYALFADTVGQRTALAIRGADGTERQAVVIPTPFSEQRQRRYETWVRQRRAMVDRLSGGRLGYIHIQGMSIPSFEEFERGLHAAAAGREGLIVDVRSNGGGWTTDYLLAVLTVRRHAYTVPRDADPSRRGYPQDRLPLAAWTRPALTLCNEDSYSNAEIFSSAFKALGRGPLVGSPTFGAVISTGGTELPNGGYVRLPMRGWYVASTGVNMENNGAKPDVEVWMPPPEDTASDRDTQLERAVETLLAGLESDPRHGAW